MRMWLTPVIWNWLADDGLQQLDLIEGLKAAQSGASTVWRGEFLLLLKTHRPPRDRRRLKSEERNQNGWRPGGCLGPVGC